MDRADIVHDAFVRRVKEENYQQGATPAGPLAAPEAVAIFRAQCSVCYTPLTLPTNLRLSR